jgi:hypothetical protein
MRIIHSTSLGVRRNKYAVRDVSQVHSLLFHITGVGMYRHLGKPGTKTPLDCAAHVYRKIMTAGPHAVISEDGVLVLCPKELAAHHTGGPRMLALNPQPAWHKEYIKNCEGAAEAFKLGWSSKTKFGLPSANVGSFGVELTSPRNAVTGLFTNAQLDNLIEYTNTVIIPEIPSIQQAVSHSFLAPARRTAQGNPWDPPPRLYRQLYEALTGLLKPLPAYLGPVPPK